MFCDMENAYPSQVNFSHSITISCTSPKQEERLLHDLAAQVNGKIVKEENENAGGQSNRLTYKENLVFGLLQQGFTCKHAGEILFVSTATIQDHKKSIFKKLDVHSRSEFLKKFPHRVDGDTLPY